MNNFLKDLKNLKEIEPSLEWTLKNRSFLMSKVEEEKGNFFENFNIFILRLERRLIPSPVKAIAALLVLCLAGGTTLAARAAIPGSPLYPVKTQIEKVELILVTSSKSEAAVHLKHAKNRIFEVEQLAKQEKPTTEQQMNNMNNVVKNLQKDISAAQNSLEIAENEDTNVGAVVAVAVQLNQGAVQASQVLNQTAVGVASEETKKTMSEAVETTETVQDNTTTMIVDKKVNGLVSDQIVTTEQVKEIVVNNINTIENKIKSVEEKVNQIEQTKVTEAINQQDVSANNLLRDEEVTEMLKKPGEAKLVLEEAKKLVNETDLSAAVEKAQESKEIAKATEKVLDRIDKVIKDQSEQNQDTTGTDINKFPADQINSTTTASTTALEVPPLSELGGMNNEADVPVITEEEEPAVIKTPTITN